MLPTIWSMKDVLLQDFPVINVHYENNSPSQFLKQNGHLGDYPQ